MSIAGKSVLLDMIERFKIVHPFDYNLLSGDDYELTVGEPAEIRYLEHRNVTSHEIVFAPPNYIGYMSGKTSYGRRGLNFISSLKVHSGWIGRIVLEYVNLSNERDAVRLMPGDPLIHVEFIKRLGPPSVYKDMGGYMFQFLTDEEAKVYRKILAENFSDAYDMAMVDKQIQIRLRPARKSKLSPAQGLEVQGQKRPL